MIRNLKARRPSASMLVAIFAVVLACAGSATAAGLITSKQVKNNSLTGGDVKNKSLKLRDIAPATRTALASGGSQGPQGNPGNDGAPGVSGYELVAEESASGNGIRTASVECPAGKKALSAGASVPVSSAHISNVRVSDDGTKAIAAAYNKEGNATPWSLTVRAVCANVG